MGHANEASGTEKIHFWDGQHALFRPPVNI
jgi:hypothetical protein